MSDLITSQQAIILLRAGKKVQRRLKGFHAWIEVKSVEQIINSDLFGELRHEYREFVPMTADIAPLQRQCREASQKTY